MTEVESEFSQKDLMEAFPEAEVTATATDAYPP
jgi:hypothetical protein